MEIVGEELNYKAPADNSGIKVTIKRIVDSIPVLQTIANQPLPIATAYRVNLVVAECDRSLAVIEAHRKRVFAKHATPPEKEGEDALISPDNQPAFDSEIAELIEEGVDLDIKPLLLTELPGLVLSSAQLELVKWLIEAPQ